MGNAGRPVIALLVCAFAAVLSPSCQKLTVSGAEEELDVHFTAEGIATKTMFDAPVGKTYATLWCDGDEVAVSMNYGNPQTLSVIPADGGNTADFQGSFRADGSPSYRFYALCPASAGQYLAEKAGIWNVVIPEEQYPHMGTPDPEAQLIASASDSFSTLPGNVSFSFSHITAYGCLSFTNLDLGDATMESVTLIAPMSIAGDFDYHLDSGEVEDSEGTDTLTLYTSDTEDIWFALAPCDLGGKTLTVRIGTDKGDLERNITFPEGRGFRSGRIQRLTVDMSGVVIPNADVTTLSASGVGESSAKLNATYSGAKGTIYEAYFRYGTAASKLDKVAYYNDGGLTGTSGSFSVEVSSLEANTTYYFQAWMQVGEKDFCGEVMSFTTEDVQSTAISGYLELPAFDGAYNFDIYCETLGSGTSRNYSYYYDKSVYACLWVAYPLTSSHLSGSGGSKSWSYNPNVPEQYQINVKSNSYGSNYGNSTYSRGHQIPNADRKCSASMNNETYYLTNQTPQIQNGFNGTVWSNLEDNVRSLVSSTDTLYVVTGAVFQTLVGRKTYHT